MKPFISEADKEFFTLIIKKYIGRKDDIFLCQPNDIHSIINSSSKELVILVFKTNEDPEDLHWLDKK